MSAERADDGALIVDFEPLPGDNELRPTVVADREVPAVDRNGRHYTAAQPGQRLLVRRARELGLTRPAEKLAYIPISDAEAEAIEVERARRRVGPKGHLSDAQHRALVRQAEDAARFPQ